MIKDDSEYCEPSCSFLEVNGGYCSLLNKHMSYYDWYLAECNIQLNFNGSLRQRFHDSLVYPHIVGLGRDFYDCTAAMVYWAKRLVEAFDENDVDGRTAAIQAVRKPAAYFASSVVLNIGFFRHSYETFIPALKSVMRKPSLMERFRAVWTGTTNPRMVTLSALYDVYYLWVSVIRVIEFESISPQENSGYVKDLMKSIEGSICRIEDRR